MRIGVLTDIHVVPDEERQVAWQNRYDFAGLSGRLERAVELFAAEGVAFVVALGDFAHDGDAPSLRQALRPLTGGPPLLVVGGNHDGVVPTSALAALRLPDVRLLDWRAVRATGREDRAPARVAGLRVKRRSQGGWVAARPPALTSWREHPVVLAAHFPVLSRVQRIRANDLRYAGDLADHSALAGVLRSRTAPTVVICGHLHVRESVASGPLVQLACGALVEPPFEATVLDIDGNGAGLTVRRTVHELGSAPEERDPRLAPAEESWKFRPASGWQRSRRGSRAPRARRPAP